MSRIGVPKSLLAALGVVVLAASALGAPEALKSGVGKGAMLPAYKPTHVTGPDKGTSTCPVCKYPRNPAVQAWINTDNDKNVAALVSALEKTALANHEAKLKAFVVFVNPKREAADVVADRLKKLGAKLNLEHVSLMYLPGPEDPAVKGYGINTDARVRNTIFVYKNRTVNTKFVNFSADEKGVKTLNEAIAGVL